MSQHQQEQQAIQNTLTKLQNLKTRVIQSEANLAHYENREREIFAKLAEMGIDANDLKGAQAVLKERKQKIETEIAILLPEGIV